MTKQEFIVKLAKELKENEIDVSQAVANTITKSFLNCIQDALANGEKITFTGFGTFETVDKKARTARSPKDGSIVNVPAKTVPKFKFASSFKNVVVEAHKK